VYNKKFLRLQLIIKNFSSLTYQKRWHFSGIYQFQHNLDLLEFALKILNVQEFSCANALLYYFDLLMSVFFVVMNKTFNWEGLFFNFKLLRIRNF
jgi:hypothetical protein